VHKPAKYLKEDLKRVLWVGGGDSGPLNEVLKYPSLELAVGLELDQQVTRLAFKHFASRPHYDNPKVQWWYGDASKSLLMLPKEYFGSFDLVIVDLSDTVFSLSVSAELDVIEAISLLLRPGGIFEMNELFLKKVSNVFEYAVHYHFQDVPKILDQAAIFASNDVDFMYQELTEHKLVENATLLVEKDSMKTRDQFDRVHDYRHNPNPAFKRLCKKMEDGEKEEKPQTDAPGIMMIVEAENLAADLSSPMAVRSAIIEAIEGLGLTVVTDKTASTESSRFVIMMGEGYVVARLWEDAKYCALDIHLWSAFDSHEALKEAIVVNALGGNLKNKSTSSYRIVAGGMFGLPSWKEESATHGPQISKVCSDDEEVKRHGPSDIKVYQQALDMSLGVVQGKDLTVAVLCNATDDPSAESNACPSMAVAKNHPNVKHVIRLIPCLLDDNHNVSEDLIEEALFNCSMNWAEDMLDEELEDSDIIDVVVLDPGVPEDFTEILNQMDGDKHIKPDNFFIIGSIDSRKELWKRKLVDHVRFGYVIADPVFRAHVLFNTTTSSLELALVGSGDYLFMEHLTKAVTASQEKSPDVTLEIRNIFGGELRSMKQDVCNDEEFSHVTVADDYNNEDATSQWNSQSPLGTQSVARFVNQVDGKPVVLEHPETLIEACQKALKAQNAIDVQIFRSEDGKGGDGLVCTGTWETGTAVVSWDGRSQVDFNIFSDHDYAEVKALESKMVEQLGNTLKEGLRDFQPRGFGRMVNFEQDLEAQDTFFNQQ
jgi:SAM-dependent methyltransferase